MLHLVVHGSCCWGRPAPSSRGRVPRNGGRRCPAAPSSSPGQASRDGLFQAKASLTNKAQEQSKNPEIKCKFYLLSW